MFISARCKDQKMCNKAADKYPHALWYVTNCYKNKKIYDKVVSTYPSTIQIVDDQFKTEEMRDKTKYYC